MKTYRVLLFATIEAQDESTFEDIEKGLQILPSLRFDLPNEEFATIIDFENIVELDKQSVAITPIPVAIDLTSLGTTMSEDDGILYLGSKPVDECDSYTFNGISKSDQELIWNTYKYDVLGNPEAVFTLKNDRYYLLVNTTTKDPEDQEDEKAAFIEKLDKFAVASIDLLTAWSKINDGKTGNDDYPFSHSFDAINMQILEWLHTQKTQTKKT